LVQLAKPILNPTLKDEEDLGEFRNVRINGENYNNFLKFREKNQVHG